MPFYDRISSLYDELFPVNLKAIEVIESLIPSEAEKRILDLGAATAVRGASRAHVVQGSMLGVEAIVRNDYGILVQFGAVLYLGNTLPHLETDCLSAFSNVYAGCFP
ncbi:MAG: hypothetical protein NT061_04425 [Spirochaetes bacterium]|nr:hypothetical protein [Spirochaetota bacterium]